jgi:putative transposase
MSNHPHITGKMKIATDFSRFMQVVHSQFARKFNKVNGRCGQLVMDRPKTPMIETEKHLLTAMVYIDLNPVKAKMVPHPSSYKWSSYKYYAFGIDDPIITPCPSYLALSKDPKKRCEIYRMMVQWVMKSKGYLKSKMLSETCYIGNPDWVIEHYQKLKKYLKSRRDNISNQRKREKET